MSIPSRDIASAFKDKRVFITGHTGFKGSWLCLLLNALGAKTAGYALAPLEPSFYTLLGVDKVVSESHIRDIRDGEALQKALDAFAPDVVFHLAAQPLVLTALKDPVDTFATNIMGTVQVLEALRVRGKKLSVVIVSSDKCYKNEESAAPYRETDRLGGSDPYTASKACTEIVTAAYREAYFAGSDILVASARAGNVLGGGDFGLNRLVPDLFRAVQGGSPLVLRYPDAIRPWQYILDVLWGYVTLAGSLLLGGEAYADAYNFANPSAAALKVKDIVSHMLLLWEADNTVVKIEKSVYRETHTLVIDPGKAMKTLGWSSKMDGEAMLKETAGWYRLLLKKDAGLANHTRTHIRDYITRVTQK
jgi:CDP-glucose 4,6-dehydratase